MSKVFDQAHYDADDNAKFQLIDWLEKRNGFMAWVNDDQYGIDVLALRNGEQFEFEVEVKHNWTDEAFPFDTVHWSARKLKFAKPSKLNWFAMFNSKRTRALFVSGVVMLDCPVVVKDTKYTQGEKFVAVPLGRCILRDMRRSW